MTASWPNSIWDGTTRSRQNYSVNRGPDGIDFDRISQEVIAIQQFLTDNPTDTGATTVSVSGDTALSTGAQNVLVDATSGDIEITLPDPGAQGGVPINVKKVAGAGTVTVLPNAAETIDGASSKVNPDLWNSMQVVTDGTNWYIV